MEGSNFFRTCLNLPYFDRGGSGTPLVALHAYWMEASTYADLADALAPEWRVLRSISAAMVIAIMRRTIPGTRSSTVLSCRRSSPHGRVGGRELPRSYVT